MQRIELILLDSKSRKVPADFLWREDEVILRLKRYVTNPQARESISMRVPFLAMHYVVGPPDTLADRIGITGIKRAATAGGELGDDLDRTQLENLRWI